MTDLTLTDAITLIKRMETDHLAALAEKDENTVFCVDYKQLTCSLCTRQKKEIAALEAVVKERNLEWESILGQNMRHATVNDELKERIAALTAERDRLREEKDALRDHLTFLDSLKQTEPEKGYDDLTSTLDKQQEFERGCLERLSLLTKQTEGGGE